MTEYEEIHQTEQQQKQPLKEEKKKKSAIREFIESIVIAVALAAFVIVFIVQGFFIPSGSMRTTLLEGDRILVNKFLFRFEDPHRGDVIVFRFPPDPARIFVKRVIGLPGDTVELTNGTIYINGKKLNEPYVHVDMQGVFGPAEIPAGQYFVMGDNRNASDDSRFWGTVPRNNILGKAFVIYYPFGRMSLLDDYHK